MSSCRCSRSIALEAGGGGAAAGGAVGVGRSVRGGGGASAVEERADEDADGLDAKLAGFSAQGSGSRLAGSQVHAADQRGVPSDDAMTVVLRQAQPLSHASDATHNLHHREACLGIVLCAEALTSCRRRLDFVCRTRRYSPGSLLDSVPPKAAQGLISQSAQACLISSAIHAVFRATLYRRDVKAHLPETACWRPMCAVHPRLPAAPPQHALHCPAAR